MAPVTVAEQNLEALKQFLGLVRDMAKSSTDKDGFRAMAVYFKDGAPVLPVMFEDFGAIPPQKKALVREGLRTMAHKEFPGLQAVAFVAEVWSLTFPADQPRPNVKPSAHDDRKSAVALVYETLDRPPKYAQVELGPERDFDPDGLLKALEADEWKSIEGVILGWL